MKMPNVDTEITIESIKHDQSLHRRWQVNTVLYRGDHFIVGYNDGTLVQEKDKPLWRTNQPAIFYFDYRYWFNIVYLLTKQPFYYCNLSSPFTYDKGVLQYIDYDLDVIVQTNGSYKIVDKGEYTYNSRHYQYPQSVKENISTHLDILLDWVKKHQGPFHSERRSFYYKLYRNKVNSDY